MTVVGKTKVFVALSGGVDSAVSAALLVGQGFDVVGVFMQEYDPGTALPFAAKITCTQDSDRMSAIAVAAHLGIPFLEWDFRPEYQKDVISYLVREYGAGRTPNPDIMCNKKIKFGKFFDRALRIGAGYIATGHYARIGYRGQGIGYRGQGIGYRGQGIGDRGERLNKRIFQLMEATDKNKDQTYFLYTLNQKQLSKTLFPIGGYTKPEVRRLAKKFGLPNWNRKDSQGICFIGRLSMKEFLKSKISSKKGPLCTLEGKEVGTHEGAWYYTIGQRHGTGFCGGDKQFYVVDKDIKRNIVYVAQPKSPALHKNKITATQIHWISGSTPHLPLRCKARIRYRQKVCTTTVGRRGVIRFVPAQNAVAPGQAVVFYKRNVCLGGGTILS